MRWMVSDAGSHLRAGFLFLEIVSWLREQARG